MKLLAATGNKDKIIEFARILAPLGIEVVSPDEVGAALDVEETGETFDENAKLKAVFMHELTGLPVVADDSGLCVDALGGRPGVHSARYLDGAPQFEKNLALLRELEGVPEANRTARFVCSIYCIVSKDTCFAVEGKCEGKIAYAPSGGGGFGYDPIFLVNGKSFAALSGEEKDAVSHRGKALRALAKKMREYLPNNTEAAGA